MTKEDLILKIKTLARTVYAERSKAETSAVEYDELTKFPELKEKVLTLDDIYKICEQKYKDHVVYARVIQGIDELEKNYKIMDLSNPMLDENDKKYLTQVVNTNNYNYIPEQFVAFYNEDKLGGMIRNVEFWVKDIFEKLKL